MIDLGPDPTNIDAARPRLRPGVRLAFRNLLGPESVYPLIGSAAEVLELCDGHRTIADIARTLDERYVVGFELITADVVGFLQDLAQGRGRPEANQDGPTGLLAELTHRCPLHCAYCSNPPEPPTSRGELDRDEWSRVLAEAAELGVLQVHFSGGEPLLRPDLPDLITSARSSGLYTNLITSGLGLDRAKTDRLREAGLDHIQISFQADEPVLADSLAGVASHGRKIDAARAAVESGLALTVNVVLHRGNLDRIAPIIAFAESLGPSRIELAHAQYYGWAWENRGRLIPTRDQVEAASILINGATDRLRGRIEVVHVLPDYFGTRPKPCMNGWGRRQLTVDPVGDVLPCPTARSIPSLRFENVRDRTLRAIWEASEAFNRFRGTSWMPDPCRSCDLREVDFGGCRCQSFLLTGDASATDPACDLSPHRDILERWIESPGTDLVGRQRSNPVSRRVRYCGPFHGGIEPKRSVIADPT